MTEDEGCNKDEIEVDSYDEKSYNISDDHKNEDYTPSEDVIDNIFLRKESDLDHLKTYTSNEALNSTCNIMGCRIDLLLSSFKINICSCEWKVNNVCPSVARKQESKNLRVNASILEALLRLPHEMNDSNINPFTLMYSDWIGRDGMLYLYITP
ncbi:uncharacterized protein BX663DRAFT_539274 [Cokeromyces recurvatus]|uniref:uncharacterized protein n=1 Tax=Cokeromyces recurvatus TaxID=90255 RepID=UPI00221ED933|nr:uncharacterized protein BX663DRAFT_539274 [Cokeromyces recurvatus]KAI7907862.1 hypothetical protein BX663DRAFT_539274 [Cokeromyces recurvatus]